MYILWAVPNKIDQTIIKKKTSQLFNWCVWSQYFCRMKRSFMQCSINTHITAQHLSLPCWGATMTDGKQTIAADLLSHSMCNITNTEQRRHFLFLQTLILYSKSIQYRWNFCGGGGSPMPGACWCSHWNSLNWLVTTSCFSAEACMSRGYTAKQCCCSGIYIYIY